MRFFSCYMGKEISLKNFSHFSCFYDSIHFFPMNQFEAFYDSLPKYFTSFLRTQSQCIWGTCVNLMLLIIATFRFSLFYWDENLLFLGRNQERERKSFGGWRIRSIIQMRKFKSHCWAINVLCLSLYRKSIKKFYENFH